MIVVVQYAFFHQCHVFQKARLHLKQRTNGECIYALSHQTRLSTHSLTRKGESNNEISLARQSVEQTLQRRHQNDHQRGALLSGNALE